MLKEFNLSFNALLRVSLLLIGSHFLYGIV